jgi:hypothetical protein
MSKNATAIIYKTIGGTEGFILSRDKRTGTITAITKSITIVKTLLPPLFNLTAPKHASIGNKIDTQSMKASSLLKLGNSTTKFFR